MPEHQFSLVACARWEEACIQEWVEYHKSIGFDHIYLYSNDDDPLPLFELVAPYAYGPDPFITFRHWPQVGEQVEIYRHFLDNFKAETVWFSFLDIDEFFVLKSIDNITTFMRDFDAGVDCLYFNWLLYGNNGKIRRDDGATLTSYVRRAHKLDPHTKMMCRSAAIDPDKIRHAPGGGAFWHFLDNLHLPGLRCRDVLQGSMDGYSKDFPKSTEPFLQREGYNEAVINRGYVAHFQFKSEEDFLRRWRRGGFPNGEQWRSLYEGGAYKTIFASNNAVYDTYLAAFWHKHTASARNFGVQKPYGTPPFQNAALNKPSFQSSAFEPAKVEMIGSRISGGGNNGLRNGTFGFHTLLEAQPWWMVDLLAPHRIAEIHIYNRGDDPAVAARANELDVMVSVDGENWITLLSKTTAEPFGLDGFPLVVRGSQTLPYRFVMLRLRGVNYLHLQEVEIYARAV